jgi:phosphoribosyl 1,2-cyclic phosphodiesterase
VKVILWGARGGLVIPRPETRAHGVNTLCVQVDNEGEAPIVLDGGMGLPWLGNTLAQGAFGKGEGHAHILFSHTHWSHIQGVPFCMPMLIPGNRFDFYGRGNECGSTRDLLLAQMHPTYCPVPNFFIEDIGAEVEVHELNCHVMQLGSTRIDIAEMGVAHGGICMAYRLTGKEGVLAYLPAVEYLDDEMRARGTELARDADLLIHDAFYSDDEYPQYRGQGHSCPQHALETAQRAGAQRLLLFNHHPERSDAALAAIVKKKAPMPVEAARQGSIYNLKGD